MIDATKIKFLTLLKQSVKFHADEEISVESPNEYMQLMNLSMNHHVSPMIYDAISSIDGIKENAKGMQDVWRRNAALTIISQTRRTEKFLEIYKKMKANGIVPLVVKGLVCRNMYKKPDSRFSNDEDILILRKDFEKCDKLLIENGFKREDIDVDNPDYEVPYNNDEGIRIEVHISLMPNDNSVFSVLNEEFDSVFERKKTVEIECVDIYTLDDTLHFFYLLCHSYKHFIVSGFGIRQLTDMLVMAEKNGANIDWQYIIDKAKLYRMYVFLINIFDIGEKYLGFNLSKSGCPECKDIEPDSDALLEDILEGGSYGKSSMGRVHSANITLSALETEKAGAISLKSSLFPTKKYMQREYKYVKKHGWLLPVAWGQRIYGYLKKTKNMKKLGNSQTDSIAIGKQRVELLKQYGIVK